MARVSVISRFHFIMHSAKSRLLLQHQSAKTDSWCTYHIFTRVFLVFFLRTTDHGLVAVGSVGSGSAVIDFPVA